jgi:hypothetical protein
MVVSTIVIVDLHLDVALLDRDSGALITQISFPQYTFSYIERRMLCTSFLSTRPNLEVILYLYNNKSFVKLFISTRELKVRRDCFVDCWMSFH